MKQFRYFIFFVALCCCAFSAKGHIVALEGNSEYMSLLEEQKSVAAVEESLTKELSENRSLYSQGGSDRDKYRDKVIEVEQSLIDIRVKKNALSSKINAIEQSWAIDNPTAKQQSVESSTLPSEGGEYVVRIAESRYAKEALSTMDLKNLLAAELSDKRVATMVNGYISNYNRASALGVEYDSVTTQQAADSIMLQYQIVDSLNRAVARNISNEWENVVESKSFAYAMLVERLGDNAIFAKDEQLKIQAAKLIDSLGRQSVSEELLNYYATRKYLVELEYSVAKAMQLSRAVDSLGVVRDSLRVAEFNYPPITIDERLFIEYEPIKFSSKAIYNGNNLIPDGKIYERGVIYRLLVGSFKKRQAATLFRGAYPICIIKNDEGLLSYYIGGYETETEAEAARKLLLKRGFKRPEVVEWRDGVAPNHKAGAPVSDSKYRVEISGVTELSPELRSTIETQGAGHELSKVGASTFVVGVFNNVKSAEHLIESIKIVDSKVSVSLKELE